MRNIKISTNGSAEALLRQTPGHSGVWEDFTFFIDGAERDYDAWVVYEGLSQTETAITGPKILITGEPPSIKTYNQKFLDQFDYIITSQPGIKGKRVLHSQTGLPWTLYETTFGQLDMKCSKDYDFLKLAKPEKTKLLSAVNSNKNHTEGHRNRISFLQKLQSHFGNEIDIFGPGLGVYGSEKDPLRFSYHENKWDAIAPYKYHLAIENSRYQDYWTEKISDPYLAGAYPFYYGCPNINNYFPENALTVIDILKPEESIKIIEKALSLKTYEKSVEILEKMKSKVLDEYQIFPLLVKIIKENSISGPKKIVTLKPEYHFFNTPVRHIIQKIKSFIKPLVGKQKTVEKSSFSLPTENWLNDNLVSGMKIFTYSDNKTFAYSKSLKENTKTEPRYEKVAGEIRALHKSKNFFPLLVRNEDYDKGCLYYTDKLYYFPDSYFDCVIINKKAEEELLLVTHKIKPGGILLIEDISRLKYVSGRQSLSGWLRKDIGDSTSVWTKPA